MAEPSKRVYWDSCAWIGFINNEPDKMQPLRVIWEEAQRGKYEIWTSTYSHIEVIKSHAAHGDPYPPAESDKIIDEMMEQPWVQRVQLDVAIARYVRELKRRYHAQGLKDRADAIHLATALLHNVDELHTWDKGHLLPFDNQIACLNGKLLPILVPTMALIGTLFTAHPSPSP